MKIGLLDLDTSHPDAWVPVVRELGHEVVGAWDGGAVHSPGHAEAFSRRHRLPRVFASPEEMVEAVDCVFLHGCDWDQHVAKAELFLRAGKAVLVDKPLAGNRSDLGKIIRLLAGGARLAGGSALRFSREIVEWQAQEPATRGVPHTVFCGCGVDGFNYGIHAFTMLVALLGPGACGVRHLGDERQERFEVRWRDGRRGWVAVGGREKNWLPFHATVVTDRTVAQLRPDPAGLYRGFLRTVLPWLARERDFPPCDAASLVEPELLALAGLQSKRMGGTEVAPGAVEKSTAFDGAGFAESYRLNRYGTQTRGPALSP